MGTTVVGAVTSNRATTAGTIVAGEESVLIHRFDEPFDGTSPLIVFCHGSGGTGLQALLYRQPTVLKLLAQAGCIILSSVWSSVSSFGNAASVAKVEEGVTAMGAAYNPTTRVGGAKTDLIGVFGVSMGVAVWANYWNAHPTVVGAAFGAVPYVHMSNGYSDADASGKAAMDAAYSGSFATNGASRSPHLLLPNIAQAQGNVRFHYSSVDAVVRPADVLAVAADIGGETWDLEPAAVPGHSSWTDVNQDEDAIVEHFTSRLL